VVLELEGGISVGGHEPELAEASSRTLFREGKVMTIHKSTLLNAGIPTITDCVLAELEKLGPKYRLALKIAKDPRFDRLHCDRMSFPYFLIPYFLALLPPCSKLLCRRLSLMSDSGTYADDCMVQRVTVHKCYIVATVSLSLFNPS
jgi:rRNA-processing protein FCF1